MCAFAVIFCNAALIACALQRFAGQPASVRSGFAAASRRLPQILGWTLVATTVGVILEAVQALLRDKIGIPGNIIGGITQGLWGVATYVVVPVVVTEGLGPVAAIKRSSSILRRTWGESLGGAAGLGIVAVLFVLPVFVVGALLIIAGGGSVAVATVGAVCALYVVALSVVFSALGPICRAGVYSYATTGVTPTHIDASLFQSAFRSA